MSQGGVIGRPNEPSASRASGRWLLGELLRARVQARWPSARPKVDVSDGLLEFCYKTAADDMQGDLFNFVPDYPVGDAGAGFSLNDAEFTVNTSENEITWTGHSTSEGDLVAFTGDAGDLPGGVALDTTYEVLTVVDADTIVLTEDGTNPLNLLTGGNNVPSRRIFWADQLGFDQHRLIVGDTVYFLPGPDTLPAGVFPETLYEVSEVVSDDQVKIGVTWNTFGTDTGERSVFKRAQEGDPSGGFDLEIELFHYSLDTFPAGLTLTSPLTVGENSDEPGRITALVVDGPLTIDLGGSIEVTNGRSRLALAVLSRDDIDVGDGRNIIQPRFEFAQEPEATTEFRPWRLVRDLPLEDGYLQRGGDGGRGGASGPSNPEGRGGSGGVAFGGAQTPWPQLAVGTAGGDGEASSPPNRGGGGGGGGVPAGSGGPGSGTPGSSGGVPGGGAVILSGGNVTIPPAGEVITTGGGGGSGGSASLANSAGGGGGGAGGHPVTIFHSGMFVNEGIINASGGSGGPAPGNGSPGNLGSAGEITTAPIPSNVAQP